MNYPTEILPNTNRKLISCDIQSHFLIRSTPTSVVSDLIDEVTGDVRQTSICSPAENITDLSTSLLDVYTFEHNKIELTKESRKKLGAYCAPDVEVEIPIYETDFYIDENKGFWTILIENVSKVAVTYTFGDRPGEIYVAICTIVHTPTFWNYWHFSIKWYLNDHCCYLDEIQDDKLKKKISKRLSGEARAMIAKFAKIIKPDYQQLLTDCYTLSVSSEQTV
jgi:hypothetical protein